MKRSVVSFVTFACLLAVAVSARADKPAQAEKKSEKPRVVDPAAVVYDADSAFEFLKTLAGDWRRTGGRDHGDGTQASIFKVSAAGSAVVETIFPGDPSEMITVYHRNGSDLLLTHYCALWNAPVMKFQACDRAGEIAFAFEGGTNFDPDVDMHVHEGTLKIKDADTLEINFVAFANGKPEPAVRATLRRRGAK
jgi:hypothetical protein